MITKDAGTTAKIGGLYGDAFVQIQLFLIRHTIRKDHDRNFDDAGAVEVIVATVNGFFAGRQVFDIKAGFGGKAGEFSFNEAIQGGGLRGLGQCSGRQPGKDKEEFAWSSLYCNAAPVVVLAADYCEHRRQPARVARYSQQREMLSSLISSGRRVGRSFW
jgi:hypothetical protein